MSTEFKKIAFHTMGCKLNFSETSMISKDFTNRGFKKVKYKEFADIYVLNTCSVTDNADKEARKLIRQAKRKNPNAQIAVIGCYAQLMPDQIAKIDGVNLVIGTENKFNVLTELDLLNLNSETKIIRNKIEDVNAFTPSYSSNDRTRTYLKVQDGCDYTCSFCTIPLARGRSRSDTISNTIKIANQAIQSGAREIVLTGVNIGDYGKNNNESFIELIKRLDTLAVERIRISSIEPNLLTKEIIDFCAESKKFMPHFHIPLQSGSNKILKLMRRRYTSSQYAESISLIRQLIPDASIGVDVIVGFPGESNEDFMETFNFIESLDISYLHVFTYSERKNTDAANFKKSVDKKTRAHRSLILRRLSEKKLSDFYDQFIGTQRVVLFDNKKNNQILGYTDNYIKVAVDSTDYKVNTVHEINLLSNEKQNVHGSLSIHA
ncbi:MAG: tRNA (N(6)-L-threonylcarbamoyladenosine(37)-C(2))-methylthiotransferase MtaB [Candidatus Marinimicrobia bacterium]|nr:tRNA (N(6)-L-threonylcarbamoyladenosine(37)-C(2))-methylthiotransferase MtaB [Candidatus Neomarinimicrobiota bacterium]|tara:strand:+ start:1281 stop:2582 length:1302 start_codon:yes stop_codon:yes gene_type:complete